LRRLLQLLLLLHLLRLHLLLHLHLLLLLCQLCAGLGRVAASCGIPSSSCSCDSARLCGTAGSRLRLRH
jgi:hypothetical protein